MLPAAGSAMYVSDSAAVDVQKYRQLYVSAGTGPSSAVSLAPSAAAGSPAVVAAAAVKQPPASIITPNIHQPPPSLPPFPPPVQVTNYFSVYFVIIIINAKIKVTLNTNVAGALYKNYQTK